MTLHIDLFTRVFDFQFFILLIEDAHTDFYAKFVKTCIPGNNVPFGDHDTKI